jgi:hypothetical protein
MEQSIRKMYDPIKRKNIYILKKKREKGQRLYFKNIFK